MKAAVFSKTGNKKGEVVLNPEIFASRVNQRLLDLVHRAYAANLRHGTADTKTRKEVRGGGKKPWRQKGTGRARHGSIRSPIWRGGGTVFGPHPRSYFVSLSQSMREQALVSALSLRGNEKNVMVLEDIRLETPKTREWAEIVKTLPLEGKPTLCVVKDIDAHLKRASGNMSGWIEVKRARDINAYHVLQREKLLIQEDAIPVLESRLLDSGSKEATEVSTAEPAEAKEEKKRPRAVKKSAAAKATKSPKSAPKGKTKES